jgi:hypothetical protein
MGHSVKTYVDTMINEEVTVLGHDTIEYGLVVFLQKHDKTRYFVHISTFLSQRFMEKFLR